MKLKNPLSDVHNMAIVPGYLNLESQEAFERRNAPGRRDLLQKMAAGSGLMAILNACGGSSGGGNIGGPSSYPGAVTVHIYHLDDGFKKTTSVNANSGAIPLNTLVEAAGLSGVDTNITLRKGGKGIVGTTKLADYNSSQAANVSDGSELTAIFRPIGPNYGLVTNPKMFNGRSYEFGFSSEAGIVGPSWFWPLVFTNLQAITQMKDKTELLAIGFNPNIGGQYTAGYGNRNLGSTGYQVVDDRAKTIKSYVLGSNSFNGSPDFENWTIIGTGMEEVFEPVTGQADIAKDNTSYTALVNKEGKFTENGSLIMKDALARAN